MNTLSQWLHQHDILIVIGAVLFSSALLLWWQKSWPRHKWLVWGCVVLLSVVPIWLLRTPSVSIAETPTNTNVANIYSTSASTVEHLVGGSIAEIEAFLQSSDKPTLVEIYSDYGIS